MTAIPETRNEAEAEPLPVLLVSELHEDKSGLRDRILQEARTQYEQIGFARVSMDDIASSLSISKKTLYHHFDSKEELIRAVLQCNLSEIDAGLKAIHHDAGCGILEKLRRLVSFITNVYSKLSPNLLHDLRKSQPEVWNKIQEHRKCQMDTDFVELIRNGQKQGLFRSDIDERLFLRIYMAAVQDVLQPGTLSEMPFPPQEVYATLSRIFFEGFLTDKARVDYHAQN